MSASDVLGVIPDNGVFVARRFFSGGRSLTSGAIGSATASGAIGASTASLRPVSYGNLLLLGNRQDASLIPVLHESLLPGNRWEASLASILLWNLLLFRRDAVRVEPRMNQQIPARDIAPDYH